MKIITLTLNPAFDLHCFAENFRPYHESIAEITSVDAGGKGVNISRALTLNGTENKAVVIVGRENGNEFCTALENENISVLPVWTEGRIRENITLHEKNNPETRISFNGFKCENSILNKVHCQIGEVDSNTVVAFTGSICGGVNTDAVLSLLETLKNRGAKIVIDSRSVSLAELLAFKPWLVKPNKDEAEQYTGKTINSVSDASEIATELFREGIENVMISLGADGAVLVCKEGTFYAKPPEIMSVSTIGAGDSAIAGFIDAAARGESKQDSLKRAIAFGSAACLRNGTLPPLPEDILKILNQIRVR